MVATDPFTTAESVPREAPAIELINVSCSVPDGAEARLLLDSISLVVERGEMVAVMGPSGSGKSTLLMLAAGLLVSPNRDAGVVRLDGRDLAASGRHLAQLRRDVVGYVEQRLNLIPTLSAGENVTLPLAFGSCSAREIRDAAVAALADVGLEVRSMCWLIDCLAVSSSASPLRDR